jgi:hypothetical protein
MTDMFAWAKIAYKAYGETTEWKNFQGEPMPEFENLPLIIKKAWERAALAVRDVPS